MRSKSTLSSELLTSLHEICTGAFTVLILFGHDCMILSVIQHTMHNQQTA